MASTDIEKKSLEAHVELCAERYNNLEQRLNSLHDRMGNVERLVVEIKEAIAGAQKQAPVRQEAPESSNKTIITIGTAIIAALIGGIFTLIVHVK